MVAGGLGAVATYLVALVLLEVNVVGSAVLSLSGATPASAAAFSWGVVYIAFVSTWWLTVPIDCLAGYTYVTVVETAN